MLQKITAATLLALAAGAVPAATTRYTLEPNYTQAVFHWDHLGFAHPAAQVSQGAGELAFDPADPARSSVSVTLPLSTLNTGVPALDEHLKSDDFFDVGKYPTATFTSVRVSRGAASGHFEVAGDLTLRGVTKPVTLDVTLLKTGTNPRDGLPTIGFDAATTLKRSDFGLGKYIPQVGDAIPVRLTSQAAESRAYAKYLADEAEAEKAAAAKDSAH